ncbi:MAG TPA: hypothetical protein VMP11_11170 [Verrucomicrobiae bacterium]|nr:hypothetical protein [Verrucomicrobiae bacterium]
MRGLCYAVQQSGLVLVGLALLVTTSVAQEFANVEYLCADWGPAMTLPAKTNEAPQFSGTDEEIYFVKQVTRFTRRKMVVPDPLSDSKTEDIGHGVSIYLCKMKPDGSNKTEISELWANPRYPIDTQAQTTWMSLNQKTRKIALAIVIGGEDITGLWTINLDGSGLTRIQKPSMEEGGWSGFNNPSWTTDGQWIVFGKGVRNPQGVTGGIAKCDPQGSNAIYVIRSSNGETPCVSPDGKTIVYGRIGDAKTGGLYLVDIDGKNVRQLLDPKGKPVSGTYPTWSPDGKRIFAISAGIRDATSGERLVARRPLVQGRQGTCGWSHWGSPGFVGFTVGGILFTDSELREGKWIGPSHLAECPKPQESCRW